MCIVAESFSKAGERKYQNNLKFMLFSKYAKPNHVSYLYVYVCVYVNV